MTQEDKQLLLKDLCGRLLYGVIVKYKSQEGEGDVQLGCGNIGYVLQLGNGWWKECKPYLRPMSSIAELITAKEWSNLGGIDLIDWYNANHIDYRGLIEKGLAIAVTKYNNPYKL